jgi:hypothetical protein
MCLLIGLIFMTLCKINVEVNDGISNDVGDHPPPRLQYF